MTKKWTKNTTLKYKRKKDIESLVFAAIDWCKNNLKSNKKLPMIWIDWAVQKRCYGEYCFTDNEIIIYPKIHTHVKDIVDTAIHVKRRIPHEHSFLKILPEKKSRFYHFLPCPPHHPTPPP